MRRTDVERIDWPKGIRGADRKHCRRMINSIADSVLGGDRGLVGSPVGCIIVSCSGGVDSTVLAHSVAMAKKITYGEEEAPAIDLVYINHMLRDDSETKTEELCVEKLAESIGAGFIKQRILVPEGNVQEKAREVRYEALGAIAMLRGHRGSCVCLTGHNANDQAETRLWNFITGRERLGISTKRWFTHPIGTSFLVLRPLLKFTRDDIMRYACSMELQWCEDSTNATNKYARNKIRHDLIPWIERHMNPGIVKMLSSDD